MSTAYKHRRWSDSDKHFGLSGIMCWNDHDER